MPKIKGGQHITWKEFFKRWGEGIRAVTPLQQSRIQLTGQFIVLAGILWGIIFGIWFHMGWLVMTLFGSLVLAVLALVGTYQKYSVLINIENLMKNVEGGLPPNE